MGLPLDGLLDSLWGLSKLVPVIVLLGVICLSLLEQLASTGVTISIREWERFRTICLLAIGRTLGVLSRIQGSSVVCVNNK